MKYVWPVVALAMALSGPLSVAQAQQRSALGMTDNMHLQNLARRLDNLEAEYARMRNCQQKGMLYIPGSPDADEEGCLRNIGAGCGDHKNGEIVFVQSYTSPKCSVDIKTGISACAGGQPFTIKQCVDGEIVTLPRGDDPKHWVVTNPGGGSFRHVIGSCAAIVGTTCSGDDRSAACSDEAGVYGRPSAAHNLKCEGPDPPKARQRHTKPGIE